MKGLGVVLVGMMLGVAWGRQQGNVGSDSDFRWTDRHAAPLSERETLRNTRHLTRQEKRELVRVMVAEMKPFEADINVLPPESLYTVAKDMRLKTVDLNGDGRREVMLQAYSFSLCGATGNCQFWVYERQGRGFRKLLDSRGKDGVGGIRLIEVRRTRTNGYLDLVLGVHDSCCEEGLEYYRYRGGEYRLAGSYIAYADGVAGFRRPKIVNR
jgi:hypothetical protein